MAEPFRKTYISVHEFVNSWEKEIYELSNLDYFSYLLINRVAGEIETGFLPGFKETPLFRLQSDEVGTLAFNIGDNLQQFFEEYCFGSCPLNCPVHLSEPLTEQDESQRREVLQEIPLLKKSCRTKESCLYTDVMNFVVVESLIEFFHFEKGMMIDEKEYGVVQFSDFIVGLVIDTINRHGQSLLRQVTDSAAEQFEMLLKNTDSAWNGDAFFADPEEEVAEGEEWKLSQNTISAALDQFVKARNATSFQNLIVDRFREFTQDFLQLRYVEEIHFAEIREFLTVILMHEVLADPAQNLTDTLVFINELLRYLDYDFATDLESGIKAFRAIEQEQLERAYSVMFGYNNHHPLLNYLLSEDAGRKAVLDGFFRIQQISDGLLELQDIHLKSIFKNVRLPQIDCADLQQGDILHMQILPEDSGYRLAHLEMIYPAFANEFLY